MIDLYHALSLVKQMVEREENLLRKLEIANLEISKANKAKTEFLARSSHDIKNYVFGVCGLASMLLDEKHKSDLTEDDFHIIQTISNQADELMHFVEDLLDTAQAESGEFGIGKFRDCDVATLINRIVLLNKSFAIRHHVTLKIAIENDLPLLTCDERRVKQILVNLISNAIKYSYEKTLVTIKAGHLPDKKQIFIEVQDNGIGMTKEEIDMALSGRGKSIDKSALGKEFDSHGIGIPIVVKLVELHHGKVEFDSTKGVGTKVRILFNLINPRNE